MAVGLVEPEARLRLDEHPGNTRNTDVLVHGMSADRRVLAAVEAKADEPFGQTIKDAYEDSPKRSNRPDRINRLCVLLFGHPYVDDNGIQDSGLGSLRYQLLHGIGAALLEAKAKQADIAVFAVQVFRSDEGTLKENLDRNAKDLFDFLRALEVPDYPPNQLVEIRPLEVLNWEDPRAILVGSTYTDLHPN